MTTYTPAQAAAIACVDRTLQIIACAGSGKTQVISQRISDILKLPGVTPANVVAFTFTDKAAAELKDRVTSIVETEHGEALGLAEMYIGTMHGYCLNLLQTYVPDAFKYSVLTDITQRLFIDRNSRKSGLTETPTLSPNTPKLRRYIHSRLYMQVLSILQEDDVDFELVPAAVTAAMNNYWALLSKHAFFDYSGMIQTAVQYLETDPDGDLDPAESAILDYVQSTIRYVVVDEYQDVNPLQERLVRSLTSHGANLCVVGDDDQTIYQWRGSEVSNIVTFAERYQDVAQVTLADNFRSSKGVVELGRAIAEAIPEGKRLAKKMEYASHQVWERGDLLALTCGTAEDEARWTCDRILAMRGLAFSDQPEAAPRGLSWSDFAILFRSVAKDAGPLVEEMRRRGIPFVVKGLTRLFDAPEIKALVGLFRYMIGELNRDGLRALWTESRILPEGASLGPALTILDRGGDFDRGDRWGTYNIQRLYLEVLEGLGIREDTIPGDPLHAELVFYQLGKFSQVISDFESIHFSAAPRDKYDSFAKWLEFQAPGYYDEADEDAGYAEPDAVTITTVHRSKGMQWPAVFLPCLRRNRFPAKRQGGLGVFHVIPLEAVPGADRYRGSLDDERRLFYVAVTRAQKYLAMTFSPGDSTLYKNRSDFFTEATAVSWVSTTDEGLPSGSVWLEPKPKREDPKVALSFSELKYFFECPYQFKLRFMYGFNPPIHEALGYGKGLHDALSEMHKRALAGDLLNKSDVADLVSRHLHTPYAYPALREQLEASAIKSLNRYFDQHGDDLERTLHSEKQIQVRIGPGVTVDGRIDLIKRLDTNEVSIVDFKSTDRAQAEDITRDQLHVYAIGYQELTGMNADVIEVLNLDAAGKNTRESVQDELLSSMRIRIHRIANEIRENHFECHHGPESDRTFDDLAWLCQGAPEYFGGMK